MHLDPNCPYCGQPADTSDGPFGEDESEERECGSCEKSYTIRASISIDWYTKCLPSEHDYQVEPYKNTLRAECSRCDAYAFEEYENINDEHQKAAFAAYRETAQ